MNRWETEQQIEQTRDRTGTKEWGQARIKKIIQEIFILTIISLSVIR
jgi:hypothetical protein